MKKLLLIIVLNLASFTCFCQIINGKVVRISDGDTITILDSANNQVRIRLYGIDSPEIGQDFGQAARKYVSDLIAGEIVNIEVRDIDRYDRTVGVVWTLDSINVNLELLKKGLAWHYKYFDQSEEYAEVERLAKT